jgi:hypothetical protein
MGYLTANIYAKQIMGATTTGSSRTSDWDLICAQEGATSRGKPDPQPTMEEFEQQQKTHDSEEEQ